MNSGRHPSSTQLTVAPLFLLTWWNGTLGAALAYSSNHRELWIPPPKIVIKTKIRPIRKDQHLYFIYRIQHENNHHPSIRIYQLPPKQAFCTSLEPAPFSIKTYNSQNSTHHSTFLQFLQQCTCLSFFIFIHISTNQFHKIHRSFSIFFSFPNKYFHITHPSIRIWRQPPNRLTQHHLCLLPFLKTFLLNSPNNAPLLALISYLYSNIRSFSRNPECSCRRHSIQRNHPSIT